MKSCCILSSDFRENRAFGLFLQEKLRRLVEDYGVRHFYVGMMLSPERTAAEILLGLQGEYPDLQIDAILAWEGEADHWCEAERDRFFRLMSQCRREIILRPLGDGEHRFQRNLMMMSKSDLVLLIGEDEETCFWARKKNKPLLRMKISPPTIIPDLAVVRGTQKSGGAIFT